MNERRKSCVPCRVQLCGCVHGYVRSMCAYMWPPEDNTQGLPLSITLHLICYAFKIFLFYLSYPYVYGVYMHTYIHVYGYMCSSTCTHVCVPVDLRLTSEFFLRHSPLYLLRQGLSISPVLRDVPSLSSQLALGPLLLPSEFLPYLWNATPTWSGLHGSGDMSAGSHVCGVNALGH